MADEKPVAAEQEAVALPPLTINPASDGKPEIRTKVWDYLDNNKVASFPWPPHKRVPNFKGAEDAGDKAMTMEQFGKAQVLKIDPDKPLQQMRIHTLEEKKQLLVPTPRLRYGFLNRITPPEDADRKTVKACVTRQGFAEYSKPVGLDENVQVDLVIVGAVAVSPKGWRVGKGEGYSDLEYAIMASMGSVNARTPVVAIVHDCQVLDLPDKIFGPHDVPVDYIVTPTKIIACENRPAKPAGIIWSILTLEKVEAIPILGKLRYRDWKAGKDVKLSGETDAPSELQDVEVVMEDTSERPRRNFRRFGRRRNQRRRSSGRASQSAEEGAGDGERRRDRGDGEGRMNGDRPRRPFRGGYRGGWRRGRGGRRGGGGRGGGRFRGRDSEGDYDEREGGDREERRGGYRRGRGGYGRGYGRRSFNDFEGSVYVGSLPRSLRVSDFKGEVRDRKVNPLRVMWRGSSGFAFLNFKTKNEAEEALIALEGLHFDNKDIRLEMAKEREFRRGGGGGGEPRRRRQRGDSRSGGEDEDEGQD